jgi:hypothetical protein
MTGSSMIAVTGRPYRGPAARAGRADSEAFGRPVTQSGPGPDSDHDGTVKAPSQGIMIRWIPGARHRVVPRCHWHDHAWARLAPAAARTGMTVMARGGRRL